jgi:hypothetical protein
MPSITGDFPGEVTCTLAIGAQIHEGNSHPRRLPDESRVSQNTQALEKFQ